MLMWAQAVDPWSAARSVPTSRGACVSEATAANSSTTEPEEEAAQRWPAFTVPHLPSRFAAPAGEPCEPDAAVGHRRTGRVGGHDGENPDADEWTGAG